MIATPTRIYRGTDRNLALLADRLQRGELVAVPTETVYGLAANALDAAACARIFKAKGRPTTDPLIVHIHHWDQLDGIARANAAAERLAEAFWPGPLTLILKKNDAVPAIVTSGKSSVAVRMPAHPLFRRLLQRCGLPLAAPSANPFGYVSPTTALHVRDGLGGKIRAILDGGASQVGVESTIVDIRNPKRPQILRPGAITAEQISRVLECKVISSTHTGPSTRAQLAPGQLKQHYSPKARVILHTKIPADTQKGQDARQAWLYFAKPPLPRGKHDYWLSHDGKETTAARHLFAKLRELDKRGYRLIHVETAPPGPLAAAINDRLRRAAAKG